MIGSSSTTSAKGTVDCCILPKAGSLGLVHGMASGKRVSIICQPSVVGGCISESVKARPGGFYCHGLPPWSRIRAGRLSCAERWKASGACCRESPGKSGQIAGAARFRKRTGRGRAPCHRATTLSRVSPKALRPRGRLASKCATALDDGKRGPRGLGVPRDPMDDGGPS